MTTDSMIVHHPFRKVVIINWKDINEIRRGKALIRVVDCNGKKACFLTSIDGYKNINEKLSEIEKKLIEKRYKFIFKRKSFLHRE